MMTPRVRGIISSLLPGKRHLLFYTAIGWMIGLWIGGSVATPDRLTLPLAFVALAAVVALWSRSVVLRLACVLLFAASLGAVRASASLVVPAALPAPGTSLQLRGVVDAEPDMRDRTVQLTVRLEEQRLRGRWLNARGKVLVQTTRLQASPHYGDRLLLSGQLSLPGPPGTPGAPSFDYAAYLHRLGIGAVMTFPAIQVIQTEQGNPLMQSLIAVREYVEAEAGALLPEPQASLLRACLIGTRSATFADLTPEFVDTGMVHIIATSGFKVTIVAATLMLLWTPLLGRRRAAIPCLLGIAGYVVLTGVTPAGVRASLMWAGTMTAMMAGRRSASGQALALSAAILTGVDPPVLFDSGFQLSAAATAGLLVFGPMLHPWLGWLPRWAAEPIGATIAAQLATIPILMIGFQQLSLVSPLANLLCLPVLPAIMILGAVAMAVSAISPILALPLAWATWVPLTWMIDVVHILARIPYAALPAEGQGTLFTVAYYGLLATAVVVYAGLRLPNRSTTHTPSHGGVAPWVWRGAVGVLLTAVVGGAALIARPRDTALHVVVLDVGQGDAVLLATGGQKVLINGGPRPQMLALRLGERLALWDHHLDLLVLTSFEQNELQGALEVISRYRPRAALTPPGQGRGPLYEQWVSQTSAAHIDVQPVTDAVAMPLSNGATRVEVRPVWSQAPANRGRARLLLRVVSADSAALICGNLDPDDQRWLISQGASLAADLLVAPHHGTVHSLVPEFLSAVSPHVVVISSAADKVGSPSGDTLEQLTGLTVLQTTGKGSVDLATEGHGWWNARQ